MTTAKNDDLDRLRLPELQKRYESVVGKATRCPNRTFLLRGIRAAVDAKKPTAAAKHSTSASKRGAAKDAASAKAKRGRFTEMNVEQLQAQYTSVVGRPTGSTDRRYLIWKIREAEGGRIPIGPRATRTPGQQAQTDVKILPLRIGTEAVERIDAAWRNAGMKSRMEFFRRALGHFLKHLGQREAAALFAAGA